MPTLSGKAIRRIREDLGMNQPEFAAKLMVTRFAVIRWENGQNRPQPIFDALIRKMAKKKKR